MGKVIQFEPAYIRLVTNNINGMKFKKLELLNFCEKYNLDVIFVQETWLKGERFTFPNYNVFRNDREARPKGGTLILCKKHIPAFSIPNPDTTIEGTFIQIKTKYQILNLGSVYSSPAATFDQQNFKNIFENNNTTLIAGDLNAKNAEWGCRATNAKGRTLAKVLECQDFTLLAPEEHTHIATGGGGSDILDIFLAKNINTLISTPKAIYDLTSDHLPVLLELGDPAERGGG